MKALVVLATMMLVVSCAATAQMCQGTSASATSDFVPWGIDIAFVKGSIKQNELTVTIITAGGISPTQPIPAGTSRSFGIVIDADQNSGTGFDPSGFTPSGSFSYFGADVVAYLDFSGEPGNWKAGCVYWQDSDLKPADDVILRYIVGEDSATVVLDLARLNSPKSLRFFVYAYDTTQHFLFHNECPNADSITLSDCGA